MPSGQYLAEALSTAVASGMVASSVVDDHLIRRFCTTMGLGLWDAPPAMQSISTTVQAADGAYARQIAAAGIVLLKNDGALLPLDKASVHKIALIGPYASAAKTGGGGSSAVVPLYTVTPMAGMQSGGGVGMTVTVDDGSNAAAAQAAAAAADVAIVMVGDSRAEGQDDPIALAGTQDALVTAIASSNKKTIVVAKTGSAVLMPWAAHVPAIVEAWYPGQEDGDAIADVLFGAVNPSGKLPLTFPVALADLPANTPAQYPAMNGNGGGIAQANYSEGLLMGYRSYDARMVAPLFPFVFGLSYTTFTYANVVVTPGTNDAIAVDFDVTNDGTRARAPRSHKSTSPCPRPRWSRPRSSPASRSWPSPPAKLRTRASSSNRARSNAWDTASAAWAITPGDYGILVGASSRDIRLKKSQRDEVMVRGTPVWERGARRHRL